MSALVPAAMRRGEGPFYCGTCVEEFPTAQARDEHEVLHLYDPDEDELP